MIPTTLPSTQLPRARSLTDALLAPAGLRPAPEHVAALRRRLQNALAYAAEAKPVRVDAYLLRHAHLSQDRLSRSEQFHWSPLRARRSIGLSAVRRCISGEARTPGEAVASTAAQLISEARQDLTRPGSLARWLAELPGGGLAAVVAEATTWATRLCGVIEWDRLVRPLTVGGPDQWWDCPGPALVGLRGRADLRVTTLPGGDVTALFSMIGGYPAPTARSELGLAALVAALSRPAVGAPTRVVGWWPDCGRALVLAVDLPLLEQTADSVVSAVQALAAARPSCLTPPTTSAGSTGSMSRVSFNGR